MEERNDILGMLDMITAPGFCVKENQIIKCNPPAAAVFLTEGMEIQSLLGTGWNAYTQFAGGCLCLNITHMGKTWNATVSRIQDVDVFLLEPDIPGGELQALALAARELRSPLNSAMIMAGNLLEQDNPQAQDSVSRLNRALHQLLRIVGNMSDAGYACPNPNHSLHEINTVMDEIMGKAEMLCEAAGLHFYYTSLNASVFSLCDPEVLERAIMNILSNSIKFSPKGSAIQSELTQTGNLLKLSIQDQGCGISDAMMRSIFSRYLRQNAIEDSRFGLGLGMVLVRAAAMQHGGTVLIDQPADRGTRVTLTLEVRQEESRLSDKILRPIAGGYDTGLVELSDVLPASLYLGK